MTTLSVTVNGKVYGPREVRAELSMNDFLREYLGISDSDLSKQMTALEKAGYVSITKTSRGRGGATTYRITKDGAAAFQRHLAALRAITDQG